MLQRRDFIRGAGLVAVVGAFAPLRVFAGDIAKPPADFASNHNYYIYGGGQPIRGLKVTIDVTEDVIAPTGLNMQLNAYSPKDANCVYQQFCMGMSPKHENRLGWSNENFPSPDWRMTLYNEHHHNCGQVANPTPATCKGDIFNVNTGEVAVSPAMTNRLPAGCQLTWELFSGPEGSVIGSQYSFSFDGKTGSSGRQMIDKFPFDGFSDTVGPKSMAPILAFQMNIVGLNGGAHAQLGGGAGSITYEATTPLEPRGTAPEGLAAAKTNTGETSNVTYAKLRAGPSQRIVQGFGTPYGARVAAGSPGYEGNEAGPTCPQGQSYNSLSKSCGFGHGRTIDNDKAPPMQQPR